MFVFTERTYAQKNSLQSADQAFKNQEYFDAIELYKKAYTDLGSKSGKKNEKARIIFQIAECYRMINEPKQEEQWYAKAIKAKYDDPKAQLYLADAQRMQGNYDDAMTSYNAYKAAVPSDPRGDAGVKSCQLAAQLKNSPTRYVVTNVAQLNTKFQDFAACYADRRYDEIFFTSTRPGSTGDKIDNGLGQTYSDIYDTKMDKNGKFSEPTPLAAPANSDGNDGTPTFDHKFKTMYFTRCLLVKGQQQKCKIYTAERKGTAWGEPAKLSFQLDSVTYGHPTLTPDDQTLLFASDLTGGYGQHDIWMSHYDKKTKTWGDPVNLGPDINTPGDEVYPFIHNDGSLYFSSDGYPGMGGKDIYHAAKTGDNKWGNVTNMGVPINSEGDDFAIVFEGNKERGYFSSNRLGGKGSDDLYSFALPPLLFDIQGHVYDKDTHKPITKANVHMVGSDGSDVTLKTDTGGFYNFGANGNDRYVKPNTSYIVTADASDQQYLASDVKANETTVGLTESKTFIHDFVLQKATINNAIRFPKVEYDLDKATLRPNSKDSLNYLVKLLNDNPTIIVELDAHTDPQGSPKHNLVLSQARAQSCVDYLKSQGIDSVRLKAKGWGLTKPLPGLDMKSIQKMKTNEERQAAFQADRRTEFRVLSFGYVPKNRKLTALDSLKMKHTTISGQGASLDSTDDNNDNTPAPPQNNNTPQTPPQGNTPPSNNNQPQGNKPKKSE
jgi:peptidoglycan-associated lipoprotein